MGTPATRTLAATVATAALLAVAAAQLQRLPLLGESYFALLALFFVVGAGTAWVAVRVRTRTPAPSRSAAGEGGATAHHRREARGMREIGTVKWFDRGKGYGFVVRANGDEIFLHNRNIRRHGRERGAVSDGQRVSFVAVERERGWQAEDVEDAGGRH